MAGYRHLDCRDAREGISAALDTEIPEIETPVLDDHLDDCSDCRAWRDAAQRITTELRTAASRSSDRPPQSTLDAVHDRHRRIERRISPWQGHWQFRTGSAPFLRPDGTWVTSNQPMAGGRGAPTDRDYPNEDVDANPEDRSEPRPSKAPRLRSRRRRRIRWALAGGATLATAAVAGPLIYFHLIEGSTPAALRLPAAASSTVVSGPVSGQWTIGPGSEAGYRVTEILLGQHHTAVGRTSKVDGSIVISGHTVTAAAVEVDLAAVKSDQPSRDVQFHGYIMETYKDPEASFRLTDPISLATVPAPGRQIRAQATGQLTMRGVTRPVNVRVEAERVGRAIEVNAQIPVTFAAWHIPVPDFAVARVSSTGLIEMLLILHPAAT